MARLKVWESSETMTFLRESLQCLKTDVSLLEIQYDLKSNKRDLVVGQNVIIRPCH